MVGPREYRSWILRVALLFGLLGALWISTPRTALAKPYPTEPGPTESGDPTADDTPSPTPKPKKGAGAAAIRIGQHDSVVRSQGTVVRIPWEVYLRLLVRYGRW
jgi:hypothetical protein